MCNEKTEIQTQINNHELIIRESEKKIELADDKYHEQINDCSDETKCTEFYNQCNQIKQVEWQRIERTRRSLTNWTDALAESDNQNQD